MVLDNFLSKVQVRVGVGLCAGAVIAAIDSYAFGGEVSPIVIVIMLVAGSAASGLVWGSQSWPAALALWFCLPMLHVIKHLLGLPDTLQPNTYPSILLLAVFTLVVVTASTGGGALIRNFVDRVK